MTLKLLDAVGTIIVAVAITKGIEVYTNYHYNKGLKAGKENK